MHAFVAGREIAAAGADGGVLCSCGGDSFQLCTDCVPIALVTHQLQSEPVIVRLRFVADHVGCAIVGGNDGVFQSVIIDVAHRHASSNPRLLKDAARFGRDVEETVARVAREEHWLAITKIGIRELNSVEIMSLGKKHPVLSAR